MRPPWDIRLPRSDNAPIGRRRYRSAPDAIAGVSDAGASASDSWLSAPTTRGKLEPALHHCRRG